MECLNCQKPSETPRRCPGCKVAVYCSHDCRITHWQVEHGLVCGQNIAEAQQIPDKPAQPAVSQKVGGLPPALASFTEVSNSADSVLGSGAYSQVKLIRNREDGTLYALKVVNKQKITEDASMEAMRREIDLQKNLTHPHIIRLHQWVEDDTNLYLVLDYASRGSLFHKIRKEKKFGEEKARAIFKQTLLGLKFLHDNNIIHRDIKPENLLLDDSEDVKICDFGWCVQGDGERKTFCGTLDYMAPEMILGDGHGFKLDIWALGVLAYELVHGYAPFRAKGEAEKAQQILGVEVQFGAGVSSELRDLITNCTQLQPAARPTADELLAHPWIDPIAAEYTGKTFPSSQGEATISRVMGEECVLEYSDGNSETVRLSHALYMMKNPAEFVPVPEVVPVASEDRAAAGLGILDPPMSSSSEDDPDPLGVGIVGLDFAQDLPKAPSSSSGSSDNQAPPCKTPNELVLYDQIEEWCQVPSGLQSSAEPGVSELERSNKKMKEELLKIKQQLNEPPSQTESQRVSYVYGEVGIVASNEGRVMSYEDERDALLRSQNDYMERVEQSWLTRPQVVKAINVRGRPDSPKAKPKRRPPRAPLASEKSPDKQNARKAPKDDDLLNCQRNPPGSHKKRKPPIARQQVDQWITNQEQNFHMDQGFLAPEESYQLKNWNDSMNQLEFRQKQLEELMGDVEGDFRLSTTERPSFRMTARDAPLKKQKVGFWNTIGSFFGCGEPR